MAKSQTVYPPDGPPPLWHYGFVYDTWTVFKLARDVQEMGGAPPGYAPLPTGFNLNEFTSYTQELENDRSAVMPAAQAHTIVALGAWGRNYIQDHVRMGHLVDHIRRVYRDEYTLDPTRFFSFASARGWQPAEFDAQLQEQSANLPSADKMAKFVELLGPPGWYMQYGQCAEQRKAQYEARMKGALHGTAMQDSRRIGDGQ